MAAALLRNNMTTELSRSHWFGTMIRAATEKVSGFARIFCDFMEGRGCLAGISGVDEPPKSGMAVVVRRGSALAKALAVSGCRQCRRSRTPSLDIIGHPGRAPF